MQEKTLFDQWVVIYRRKWEILLVTLMAAITAGALAVVIDPIYEASVIFYPPKQPLAANYLSVGSEKSITRNTLVPLPNEDQLAPFIGLMKSKKIAERVAAEYPEMSVIKLLRSNMDFEVTNEYMLKLYARAKNPQLAADVANAYFRNLNLLLNEASMKDYHSDEEVFRKQLLDVETLVAQHTAELVEFERSQGIADLDKTISQVYGVMEQMNAALDQTRVKVKETEARIKVLQSEMEKEGEGLRQSIVSISTPYLEHLRIKLGDLSEQLTVASFEYGPKHETFLALQEQLEETKKKIGSEQESILNSTIKSDNVFTERLRQDLVAQIIEKESLDAKIVGYISVVKLQDMKLNSLPAVRHEWESRIQTIETFKEESLQLQKNLREMELQKSRKMEHLVLVDSAEPPGKAAFPILWLNLFIGVVVGLMGGLFYAYLLEYTKRSSYVSIRKLAREIAKNG